MEVTRLEVGDLVLDKHSDMFGVVIESGNYKAKIRWGDNALCWEMVGDFKIDEDKKIPWIDLMPF